MKVHQQFARAIWDLHLNYHHSPATLSDHNPSNHPCKRLRPLAPKLLPSASVDLKSFLRPDVVKKDHSPQVETTSSHPGGTRWNPAQEQIGILEMLYRGGMRTPNAQQIEQITAQLSKYGKIEGKNVFYWFQNHKARERQKQKRSLVAVAPSPSPSRSTSASFASSTAVNTSITLNFDASTMSKEEVGREEQGSGKRKCRTWPPLADSLSPGEITYRKSSVNMNSETDEEEDDDEEMGNKRTLELFPLHPEGRLMMGVCTD